MWASVIQRGGIGLPIVRIRTALETSHRAAGTKSRCHRCNRSGSDSSCFHIMSYSLPDTQLQRHVNIPSYVLFTTNSRLAGADTEGYLTDTRVRFTTPKIDSSFRGRTAGSYSSKLFQNSSRYRCKNGREVGRVYLVL
jgi:hypothetical protein